MTRELLHGLGRFRREHFPRFEDHYRRLVEEGQKPRTLFIGCSDSRVVPDIITDSAPGSLFVVRNVGNVVPPPEDDDGHHGVTAAIEFAVEILGVRDIVVCGHSHCGAVRALYDPPPKVPRALARWLELIEGARLEGDLTEELLRRTEQRSILLQLDRLLDFPAIRERVESGEIALHGWHYLLEDGRMAVLDLDGREFVTLD